MRWPAVWLLAGAVSVVGCRSTEPVEAELRARDHDLHQMRDEISHLEADNDALQRELSAVRQSSAAKITPELASQTYTLRAITLARQTGGYDADDLPGDEALQVVLEPRDTDGHTIKAPGSVDVQAMEITPEGLKRPLCSWHVAPEQLRHSWRSGLLTTAYFLVLPWKAWPTCEKMRIVAQFTLADGRVYEADKDVTVHLMPPAQRQAPPAEAPELPNPPTPSLDGEQLPIPRKVSPGTAPSNGMAPAALWQPAPGSGLGGAVQMMRPVLAK
jgi:hypothetical protein